MAANLRKALPLFLIWHFPLFLNFCVKTNLKIASLALEVSHNKVLFMTDEKISSVYTLQDEGYRIYNKSWMEQQTGQTWQDHELAVQHNDLYSSPHSTE